MKNIIKMIIILLIIVIIIIVTIILILFFPSKTIQEDIIDSASESVLIKDTISLVEYENIFYSIEKNIQNYYMYIYVGNKQAILEMTSQDYIKEKTITQDNILEHFVKIEDSNYKFNLKELYYSDSSIYPVYYAKCEIIQYNKKEVEYLIVYVDKSTISIEIEPITVEEYLDIIENDNRKEEKQIEKKQYNKYITTNLSTEEIITKYFEDYVYNALYDIETAYNSLDEEYKNEKYSTIDKFKQYIERKKDQLISLYPYSIKGKEEFSTEEEYYNYLNNYKVERLEKYKKEEKEGYDEYTLLDGYGNYYIMKVTAPMKYKIILDLYTIDSEEIIEKYNSGNDETKIGLNISKVIEAINNKDYEYIYNKLNETFRNNNFSNISALEEFIKDNFYNINKIEDFSYKQEGNVYICTITLKNKENETDNSKSVTILIELLEDRNFEISFSL